MRNQVYSSNDYRVLEGFLRRILKLLFFGIKPVFVFDGKTPEIKRKCVQLRAQAGKDSDQEIRKAAERLVTKILAGDSVEEESASLSVEEDQSEYEILDSLLEKYMQLLKNELCEDGKLTDIDQFRTLTLSEQF